MYSCCVCQLPLSEVIRNTEIITLQKVGPIPLHCPYLQSKWPHITRRPYLILEVLLAFTLTEGYDFDNNTTTNCGVDDWRVQRPFKGETDTHRRECRGILELFPMYQISLTSVWASIHTPPLNWTNQLDWTAQFNRASWPQRQLLQVNYGILVTVDLTNY
jgi:hypothetical protein